MNPSINGVELPQAWYLTGEQVRHLCGSAKTVRRATPGALPFRHVSKLIREENEILPGVSYEAPPLHASLAPLVESALLQDHREKIHAALSRLQRAFVFGSTCPEVSRATGIATRRVQEILTEDLRQGRVTRREGGARAWLWTLAEPSERSSGSGEALALTCEGGAVKDFRGDLDWLHRREGHRGRPYWPGGGSGVTVDPGLDLGHASPEALELLRPHLPEAHYLRLRSVLGIKGRSAKVALSHPGFQEIRTSRELARALLPLVAAPYWLAISRRFPLLLGAPAEVQTALLSLAYNRGAGNPDLWELAGALGSGAWCGAGWIIVGMQQDHALGGIRGRRILEGNLILGACGCRVKPDA